MKRGLASFWREVRAELQRRCGQEFGKRDRKKCEMREKLAKELSLDSVTLKGFLNKHQKTLGPEPLVRLFAIVPTLEARYRAAVGQHEGASVSSDDRRGVSESGQPIHVQMTLHFDGFEDQSQPLIARLPPGRAGVLTLEIKTARRA